MKRTACSVVSVVTATGKRPDPSRTRKLSLTAPMVLHPPGCGRVGHHRAHTTQLARNRYMRFRANCLYGVSVKALYITLCCRW